MKVGTEGILAIQQHHVVLPALRPCCKMYRAWRCWDAGPDVQLPWLLSPFAHRPAEWERGTHCTDVLVIKTRIIQEKKMEQASGCTNIGP